MLIFFYLMCKVCILQASRKDVASIHTSLASCEHYDWSACLQRAYCMRVSFQKYACANTLRVLMLAACMLRTRSTQTASFFFCSRHVRHLWGGGTKCFMTIPDLVKTYKWYMLQLVGHNLHSQFALKLLYITTKFGQNK